MTFTRRSFLATSSAAISAGTFGRITLFGQQQPAAPVTPVFKELRRNTGYWTARGGTIGWLINPTGVVAVDSQFPDTATLCVEQLLKTSGKADIATLINTHHHGDHTGGNKAYGVNKIVAHVNCLASHKKVTEEAKTVADQAYATATFTDTWTEKFGNETIEGRYYGPGHTGGDVVYHFQQANVMHMGDLLFNRAHPNIDRAHGARIDNWIKTLDTVAGRAGADTIFIAGHAKDNAVRTTKADVTHFRNYLTAVLDHVRAGIKAGQSKEEIQKLPALKGFEDNVSPNARLTIGFVLGIAYDELTQK